MGKKSDLFLKEIAFSAVFAGRDPEDSLEVPGEMALVGKPRFKGNLNDWNLPRKQLLCKIYPFLDEVGMGREA